MDQIKRAKKHNLQSYKDWKAKQPESTLTKALKKLGIKKPLYTFKNNKATK